MKTKALPVVQDPLVPFSFGASAAGWHEIEPFIYCPKEYQYARVRGIRQRSPHMSEPLAIGLFVHVARAQWFADGYKGERWREAVMAYANQPLDLPLPPSALPAAVSYFEGYIDYWKVRPKSKVLAVEYEIAPRKLGENAPEWLKRTARLDSVEEWRGKIWIGELKTTSHSAGRVRDTYMLHGQPQTGIALWGEKETATFGPLAGVLLDVLVKRSNGTGGGSERIALPLSDMQHAVSWFKRDFERWAMYAASIRWNDAVERRPVCMRSYGPCGFRDLCLRGKAGALRYMLPDGTSLASWQPSKGREVAPWD